MDMEIDGYTRDRERSPQRTRSPQRDRSPRRDSGRGGRGGYRGDRRGGYRGDRGGYRGDRGDRGDRGSGRFQTRDYNSRHHSSGAFSTVTDDDSRNKSVRNYDNSIFVGNIPYTQSAFDVKRMFEEAEGGSFDVIRADVVTSRGRSKGMATVEFATKDDVDRAIRLFDRKVMNGREIFVRQDYPPPGGDGDDGDDRGDRRDRRGDRYDRDSRRGDRYERDERRDDRRDDRRERRNDRPTYDGPITPEVFIGNIPFQVTRDELGDLFSEAGKVESVEIRTDGNGRSRGFGTVVFSNEEEAQRAIERFAGYQIGGRRLDTRPGHGGRIQTRERPPKERGIRGSNTEFTEGVVGQGDPSDIIFVGNLPFETSQDDLFDLFETVGRVVKAELQFNQRGQSSGTAVVQFDSEELASSAIQSLDGYNYGGRPLAISYATRRIGGGGDDADLAGGAAEAVEVAEGEPVYDDAEMV